ncbi:MAG: nitrate reductase cytochrome c-type subunit [Alphaproteobacteria bacterium]|nr:nitrate reductase cytochrome c-type subunit [Alphaproteobacteria bacterium]
MKPVHIALGAFGLIFAVATLSPIPALAGDVQSLRGKTEIPEINPTPELTKQRADKGRFTRNYRQQPPLVPHKIAKYEIDLKVNQCLRCHDWPYNVEENAPKVSETHYTDRDGTALDHIARTRWFCTQCHVPQEDAPALVRNTFKPLQRKQ